MRYKKMKNNELINLLEEKYKKKEEELNKDNKNIWLMIL